MDQNDPSAILIQRGAYDPTPRMIQTTHWSRQTGMYIMTLLSGRFRPSWSTHAATRYIGLLVTQVYSYFYIAHPLVFCPQDKPTALLGLVN